MKKFLASLLLAACVAAGAAQAQQVPPANTVVTIRSAATNNATLVKATAANLYGFSLCNKNAAVVYVKLFNKATAPTVGTDVPFFKIPLPIGGCRDRVSIQGLRFPLGLGYAIVTGETDADNTAVAAGDVNGTLDYK